MDLSEQVEKLFHEKAYKKIISFFYDSTYEEFRVESIPRVLGLFVQSFEHTNLACKADKALYWLEVLLKNKSTITSDPYFEFILKQKFSISDQILIDQVIWPYLYERGQLEEAEKRVNSHLGNLLKMGRHDLAKKELLSLFEKVGSSKWSLSYFIKVCMVAGDIDLLVTSFEKYYEDIALCKNVKRTPKLIEIVFSFSDFSDLNRDGVKKGRGFKQAYCLGFIQGIRQGLIVDTQHWESLKYFVVFIFDLIVEGENRDLNLLLLLEYVVGRQRKKLANKIMLYFEIKDNCKRLYKKHAASFQGMVEVLPECKDENIDIEEYDLGSDLFENENEEMKIFEQVKKLERDIRFLIKSNKLEHALGRMDKLRELDPDNPILVELYEARSKSEGSRVVEKVLGSEGVISSLLAEIESLTISSTEPMPQRDEKNMIKVLSLMDDLEFIKTYTDIYIAMMQMKFYDVCLYILGRVRKKSENLDTAALVGLNYMECEALFAQKKYYKVIENAEQTLQQLPLLEREGRDFLYLIAESYYQLGKTSKAWNCFLKINKSWPHYRLTKYRLVSLEKG